VGLAHGDAYFLKSGLARPAGAVGRKSAGEHEIVRPGEGPLESRVDCFVVSGLVKRDVNCDAAGCEG